MKKRRILLLLLWILSLLAISFYGGAVSYGFFWSITLIPVISLIYLFVVCERFRIFQEISCRELVCGQQMPYSFILQNGDFYAFASISVRLFPELSYVERIPEDIEFQLLPGERYTFETNLVCRYRGEYEVGVKEVVLTDFLRIFRLRYRLPSTIKALVLPRVVHLSQLNNIPEVVSASRRDALFLQSQPDVTVRDYISGDSMKKIHWKLTAREQKLKTRNYIGEEQQGITIFFETERYGSEPYQYLPLENRILEIVLALGMFFAEHRMPFQVYWEQNGIQSRRVEGIEHFESLYRQMSKILFEEENNAAVMLGQLCGQGSIFESRIFIGVVHEISDAILEWTGQLVEYGNLVVLYVVTDEDAEKILRQSSLRQRMIVVSTEAELEGIL